MGQRMALGRANRLHGSRLLRFVRGHAVKIEAAAVRVDGVTYTLPRPARHFHVLQEVAKAGVRARLDQQGFVTDCGRFLTRKQARGVADKAGQLKGPLIGSVLTSEDLW